MTEEKKATQPVAPSAPPEGSAPPGGMMIRRPDASFAPIGERGVILRTFDELRQFAKMAVESGVAPRDMKPGAAALAIQAGLERGLGPLGGLQFCTVIEGTLSWNAQGALALIRNSPVCKPGTCRAWVEGEGEDRKGVAVAHRVGYPEPFRSEFSMRDAKRADLLHKKNWIKYPDRQLQARAIGFLARDGFSDVLGGFPLAEEVSDYAEPVSSSSSSPRVAVETPAPARGPDPVLEALEGAPAVIEIETTDPPAQAEEGPAVTVPPTGGAPELEVQVERVPEPPAQELEAPRPSDPGLQVEHEAGSVSTLRAKLGVLRAASQETPEKHEETEAEDPSAAARSFELEASEQPTPPYGVEPVPAEQLDTDETELADEAPDRAAHLELDAELAAAEEQGGLFDGKEKDS